MRNSDFIQKISRLKRWWISVPKNHLTWVRNQASFVLKREKYDLLKTFWWRNPLFLQLSKQILWQCSYKPIILHQDNCYFPFCNFLTLHEWKRGVPLKTRNLRIGAHLSFRLQATFFYKCAEPAWLSIGNRADRLELKDWIQCGVRFVLLCHNTTKLEEEIFSHPCCYPSLGIETPLSFIPMMGLKIDVFQIVN